jgi:DNA polymerase-1
MDGLLQIRKAFTADVAAGNTLIVADYGQLELRLLAHMAKCVSMREAFELGGDFHSRTAFGMYDYIQAAVARGECLLEWDYPNVRQINVSK